MKMRASKMYTAQHKTINEIFLSFTSNPNNLFAAPLHSFVLRRKIYMLYVPLILFPRHYFTTLIPSSSSLSVKSRKSLSLTLIFSRCHDFPLLSLSVLISAFVHTHTHLILPSQTSPHIYRKCFCCSHKKAHDINFPSNSRHRRLRYVKGREREKQKDKNCLESQKHFTNDKHMKYFCMME